MILCLNATTTSNAMLLTACYYLFFKNKKRLEMAIILINTLIFIMRDFKHKKIACNYSSITNYLSYTTMLLCMFLHYVFFTSVTFYFCFYPCYVLCVLFGSCFYCFLAASMCFYSLLLLSLVTTTF